MYASPDFLNISHVAVIIFINENEASLLTLLFIS